MAGSLNKVMIIGNVGREPEMRYTPSGTPVTSFSVACNRFRVSPDGDRREETEWFNVVAWSKLAETCNQYITKGQKVYIEGRLQTRSWEGQDGQKHSRVEIVANNLIMLSPRQKPTGGEEEGYDYASRPASAPKGKSRSEDFGLDGEDTDPDDLPF
ncbi:MAG: single-stranded DNA-binding protein [Dehalococcoidales bacterium]|nr:single-stranded DNA-binding protein [Dehalococcoidales bacterium]